MGALWRDNSFCGCSSAFLAAWRVWSQGEIGQTCFLFCLLSSISSCISPLVCAIWVSLTSMAWVSPETRVVCSRAETGVFGRLLGPFESQLRLSPRPRQPYLGSPWLPVCPVWSPGYGGKAGGQEEAEGFTPKSTPLGHKSGKYHTEKMGKTYAASTHFVFYRTGLTVKQYYRPICRPPVGTAAMQYHMGRPGVSSLSPGNEIYPSFLGCRSQEWGWIVSSHL